MIKDVEWFGCDIIVNNSFELLIKNIYQYLQRYSWVFILGRPHIQLINHYKTWAFTAYQWLIKRNWFIQTFCLKINLTRLMYCIATLLAD